MKIKPMAIAGLHVGSGWARLVKPGSDGRIRRCGASRLPEGVLPGDRENYLGAVAEAIARAAFEANIAGGPLALVIGGADVIVRRFSLPALPGGALARNVRFELAPFLALPEENYCFGYKIFGKETRVTGDTLSVLAVACPRELPSDLAACARAAGFKPRFADAVETSREKLFRFLSQRGSPELASAVVADIDGDYARVSTYLGGRFTFGRHIPLSGSEGETRDTIAAELAAILDYAYYSGARAASGSLYVGGAGGTAELCRFLSDFLSVAVKPLQDALKPIGLSGEQGPYVDALAATMREVV